MTVQTETILERAAHARHGYRLAGVHDVLLPMALMTISASIRRPADLGPVETYILRTVQADFTTPQTVAGVLGLQQSLVDSILVDLWRADLLRYSQEQDGDKPRLSLLTAGRDYLSHRASSQTEHVELEVTYDRFLGRIRRVLPGGLLRPKRAREIDAITVRGIRHRPEATSLAPHEVEDALPPAVRIDDRFTVVRVTDILRVEDRFEPALLLTYVSVDDGNRIEQAFYVDGRPSSDHDAALADRPDVARRFAIPHDALRPPAAAPLPDASPVDRTEADRLTDDAEGMQEELATLREATGQAGVEAPAGDSTLHAQLQGANRRIEELEQRLRGVAIRRLSVFEHQAVLLEARTRAQRRLLIISPWIRASVVNHKFVEQLEHLCRRGVIVHIRYGMDDDKPASEPDQRAIDDLENLDRRLDTFTLIRGRQTHAKVLVFDDTAVTGSFNWLSFKGDAGRAFRQEESWLVRDTTTVDDIYETHRQEMVAEIEGS